MVTTTRTRATSTTSAAQTTSALPTSTPHQPGASSSQTAVIVGVVVPLLVVAVAAVLCLQHMQRRRHMLTLQLRRKYESTREVHQRIRDQFIREFGAKLSETEIGEFGFQEIEIDHARLTLRDELGRGAFGIVRMAELRPAANQLGAGVKLVAVKMIAAESDPRSTMSFLMEGGWLLMHRACH